MYTIRKKFKFEMAHLLTTSYSEECQNIHGHSYILEVIVDAAKLNQDGMVIDFKRLKEIINYQINKFDHALVMEAMGGDFKKVKSFTRMVEAMRELKLNLEITTYNPTAENMVKDLYLKIYPAILAEVPTVKGLAIRLHETDTGWAQYDGGSKS